MTAVALLLADNPYPGLRPFDVAESDRFFGRQEQLDDLSARLDDVSFLAVTGDSGCGKSSLVRAGLLHRLQRGAGEHGLRWRHALLRPGNRPLAALAVALAATLAGRAATAEAGGDHRDEDDQDDRGDDDDDDKEDADEATGRLLGRLRLGGQGLIETLRVAQFDPDERLLIVVDQFEELFRFEIDADEAGAFVRLLLNAALDVASPVRVLVTLRSDTLGACSAFPGLPEAISHGQYLVPRLTQAQRTEAIVGPVRMKGRSIDLALVQRLLNDVADSYEALPVMQHALARTWDCWAIACSGSRPIGLADYDLAGTTRTALSRHADEACGELAGLGPVIEKVFRALTEQKLEGAQAAGGGRGREGRRPLPFATLCDVVDRPPADVARVVERFRRRDTSFLMSGAPLQSNPAIDIAHESLIRLWDRLRGWLADEAVAAASVRRLVDQAAQHRERDGALLQGRSLRDALAWWTGQKPTPAWVGLYFPASESGARWIEVNAFLEQSKAESARQKSRLERRRLLIGASAVSVVAVSLAVGGLGWGLATRSKSRALAFDAIRELDRSPARAAHLALAAAELDESNTAALVALRTALADLEQAHVEQHLAGRDFRLSPDRTLLVSLLAGEGDRTLVQVLDARSLQPEGAAARVAPGAFDARLTSDNRFLVTQGPDADVRVQPLAGGPSEALACPGSGNRARLFEIAPDRPRVALGCTHGETVVWDPGPQGWRQSQVLSYCKVASAETTALAFSSAGTTLASGDIGGHVCIWRLANAGGNGGRPWVGPSAAGAADSPISQGAWVKSLLFSPDSDEVLVSGGINRQAKVWWLRSGAATTPNAPETGAVEAVDTLAHDRSVDSMRWFVPEGDPPLLLTLSGKSVQLWPSPTRRLQARGHQDWVVDAAVPASAPAFATASTDGSARLWSTHNARQLAVLRGHPAGLTRVMFLADDGSRLLTVGDDGRSIVWRIGLSGVLRSEDRWMLGAAFSPDGQRVAVGADDEAVVVSSPPTRAAADGDEGIELDTRSITAGAGAGQVSHLSWDPAGRWIAGVLSSSYRPQAVVWDSRQGQRAPASAEWLSDAATVAFCPGTGDLVTVGHDGRIDMWDAEALSRRSAAPKATFGVPRAGRTWVGASRDCRWVATVIGNDVELWSRTDPQQAAVRLRGHTAEIRSLAFSADSRWLLTASADRTARAWPLDAPTSPPVVLENTSAGLYAAAFDPQTRHVVTGSGNGEVGLWTFDGKRRAPERLASMRWHTEGVNSVAFSPDGNEILSASDDGLVRRMRCEVCLAAPNVLRDRVQAYARLLPAEAEQIAAERSITLRDLGWRTWKQMLHFAPAASAPSSAGGR